MVLAVVVAAIIGLSLFSATGVLASKPKAYVLIGNVAGEAGQAYIAAGTAVLEYELAGYDVISNIHADQNAVKNALNDPGTQALWIIGHGTYDSVKNENGKWKLTGYYPMIEMANQTNIQPSDLTDSTHKDFPNIKQVTIHACGQDLPEWQALFPTAVAAKNFRAWKSTLRPYQYLFWQWWNVYDPVTSQASAPVPVINPVLEQANQYYFDPTVGKYLADMSYLANDFPLHEPLKSQVGSQSVNVYARNTDTGDRHILFGADIADGKIASSYVSGTTTPTFDVSITNEALYNILEDPSTIWNAHTVGSLQITPYVPVDEDILFKSIAGLFFGEDGGVGGIAEPPDVAVLPADTTNSASTDHAGLGWIFGGSGAGILILVGFGTVWYARKRRVG